jgi:ornithine cyclodeaminase/alanine dehydrogenase
MSDQQNILRLSDADLGELKISPQDIAQTIEAALRAKAAGGLLTSPKSALLPGDGRYMMSTLAVGDDGYIVVKQVSVCPDNPNKGLPAINGAIMVLDANTGLLSAVLDANWVTAVRTAALSAVAARRLADPASKSIAFIGTGVQARSHLEAFKDMFQLERATIFGRGKTNVRLLGDMAEGLGLVAEVADTPEQALTDADIVVTSVTLDYSIEPFLDARWLKPNAFAAITDLCIPWDKESLSAFAAVYVDDIEQERESEKPMLPGEMIGGDLTELVTQPPDINIGQGPTAFAFRGIALGDYAASVLAVQRAMSQGIGGQL